MSYTCGFPVKYVFKFLSNTEKRIGANIIGFVLAFANNFPTVS
jgi:hypothetical protein